MIRVKYKLSGEIPDIYKILTDIRHYHKEINKFEDYTIFEAILPDIEVFKELTRRLGSKRNRKTSVDILEQETIIDKNFSVKKLSVKFGSLGYTTKLQQNRQSFYMHLSKLLVIGNRLKKGSILYGYEGYEENGRNILVLYLDGLPREQGTTIEVTQTQTFVDKQSDLLREIRSQKLNPQLND